MVCLVFSGANLSIPDYLIVIYSWITFSRLSNLLNEATLTRERYNRVFQEYMVATRSTALFQYNSISLDVVGSAAVTLASALLLEPALTSFLRTFRQISTSRSSRRTYISSKGGLQSVEKWWRKGWPGSLPNDCCTSLSRWPRPRVCTWLDQPKCQAWLY